jgi:hypothetical protein
MTYYFISQDPLIFEDFRSRISFLSSAIWLNTKKKLADTLTENPIEPLFFIHLPEPSGEISQWGRLIREKWAQAKLIYLIENKMNPTSLKEHQLGESGGDAYLLLEIEEEVLKEILEGINSFKGSPGEVLAENKVDKNGPNRELDSDQNESDEKFSELADLDKVKNHPISKSLDQIFLNNFQLQAGPEIDIPDIPPLPIPKRTEEVASNPNKELHGANMSDKDQELSLENLNEIEINDSAPLPSVPVDEGMSLEMEMEQEIKLDEHTESSEEQPEEEGLLLEENSPEETLEAFAEIDLSTEEGDPAPAVPEESQAQTNTSSDLHLDLESGEEQFADLSDAESSLEENVGDIDSMEELDEMSLSSELSDEDLSEDTKKKLLEIDAIMDMDASNSDFQVPEEFNLEDEKLDIESFDDEGDLNLTEDQENLSLDDSLVSDDLDLDSINFSSDEDDEILAPIQEEELKKNKKKKKEESITTAEKESDFKKEYKELSGAYAGELERTQATIANLREDRQELLNKIQQFEEEKILQNRQTLSLRAELDEKKIELSIMRRKLNEEITELRDRIRLQDEKKLILEEKNRVLSLELDKAGQKNKFDVKKVQMRERELEQKLELLKSDAETQIRNRDLKILELKRKIDAMEFDMESITTQEKRSVESRSDLEDKLDKAIKTLRTAITVLEGESGPSNALEVLKKNIDV